MIQGFIISTGAQIRKALPDSVVLHRGNPETEDRLAAASHFIHQTEDQLTFTPGVTGMLSAVLRSDVAIQVSINIMNVFVEMRRFIANNALLFERISNVELKQLEYSF